MFHLSFLHLGMAHSPAMHSPHVIHTLTSKSEAMGFAPVNSHHQGVRSHIPTPPRPMSNNNPGPSSMGQQTPPPPLNTAGDSMGLSVSLFFILIISSMISYSIHHSFFITRFLMSIAKSVNFKICK